MPNPTGNNQWGAKKYPPDDVLRQSLTTYAKRGHLVAEILERLKIDHGLVIKKSTLATLQTRLGVPTTRWMTKAVPKEVQVQAIIDEVEKDTLGLNGPVYIQEKLRQNEIFIPRDTVRQAMHTYFPDGFDKRCPWRRMPKVPRKALTALGPFHEVCSDGHEKLGVQGLGLGNVGIPIYAWKDKWSGTLLKISCVPTCRTRGAIGHLYIDLLEEIGAAPLQHNTDKGSEIGHIFALQFAIRECLTPDIDTNVFPPHVILKSIHNTPIEGFWRWLRSKLGLNIKDQLVHGKHAHIFNPAVEWHRDLFNWIFPPLVQLELDEFRIWWNQHRIRRQPEKLMPSNHVPLDALEHPQLYGGVDCRIPLTAELIQEMRSIVAEEDGPREAHLSWVSDEFNMLATHLHGQLGLPKITLWNSWDIFRGIAETIAAENLL